mmetsp:Transcript_8706/g.24867  ORF Transcript_8706/g.24867 Transcript_8706/m.24867 type:complete len:351 (-) Transcript_8706:159-1211(-)
MTITAADVERACAEAGVALRSPLEAARLAGVVDGKIDTAVRRVRHIRQFEAKYDIENVDPLAAFDEVQRKMPGAGVGICGKDVQGRGVLFFKVSNLYPGMVMKDPSLKIAFLRFFQIVLESAVTSMDEFEKGIVFILDCHNLGLKNVSIKFEKEIAWMYQDGFPTKLKNVLVYHAGPIMRGFLKIAKTFISRKMMDRVVLANDAGSLLQLVSPESLPFTHECGKLSLEQLRENFIARVAAFRKFEAEFGRPVLEAPLSLPAEAVAPPAAELPANRATAPPVANSATAAPEVAQPAASAANQEGAGDAAASDATEDAAGAAAAADGADEAAAASLAKLQVSEQADDLVANP